MQNREKDRLLDSEPVVAWVYFIKLPFPTSLTLETQCGRRHRKSGEQMFCITFHLYLLEIYFRNIFSKTTYPMGCHLSLMVSNFYILTSKAKIAAYSHHISVRIIILGYTLLILVTLVKKDLL